MTNIAYVLFDLDDTLYPAGSGLMKEISARITRYMVERMGMTEDVADALRREYYERYGSATRGLYTNYAMSLNIRDYIAFVHDIPIESYLAPDADLACFLDCIQAKKVIFTNAPAHYAHRVLETLGVRNCFSEIFDITFGGYLGKPTPSIYWRIQQSLRKSPDRLVMVDGQAVNLMSARHLQWRTVWVASQPVHANGKADYVVANMWEVAGAFHELGIMDKRHQVMAEHRLAGCAWARRAGAPA